MPASRCAEHLPYQAGCPACRAAAARYSSRRRKNAILGRTPRRVPALGAVRRVRALQALGWSQTQIGQAMRCSQDAVSRLAIGGQEWMLQDKFDRTEATYAELSMTAPRGVQARRVRAMARSRGWAPPLAWDDIDDPDEQPIGHLVCTTAGCARDAQPDGRCSGHQRRPHAPPSISPQDRAALVADVLHLAEQGLTDPEIGRRVGKSADAVFKIRHRNTLGEKAS